MSELSSNSPNFLAVLDGTSAKPRDIQIDYFNQLRDHWDTHRIHAMSGPPGVGKSYIARTIQRTLGHERVAILTANNMLVDQYCASYPELTAIKGMDFYANEKEYREARKLVKTHPAVYNPLSYYYYWLRRKQETRPDIVIIDEAHNLGALLLQVLAQPFQCDRYGIPSGLNESGFLHWLRGKLDLLEKVYNPEIITARMKKINSQYESLKLLYDYMFNHIDKVRIQYEMRPEFKSRRLRQYLCVVPLLVPVNLLSMIFGAQTKIILLSGTLTDFHIRELFPLESDYHFVNYEPIAPRENRLIYCKPVPFKLRKEPKPLAQAILAEYEAAGRPNTVVHCSYRLGLLLAQELSGVPKLWVHSKESKQDTMEKFKREGGIILASGMAEGVDLPGDLCRLIIIPQLLYPNLGDEAVIKRMALPRGREWYPVQTITTTVQQIGRGVRGATDACTTVVLDPMFPKLLSETGRYLTQGFLTSIIHAKDPA